MRGDVLPAASPESPLEEADLRDLCVRAVSTAAHDLGLDPLLFAEELAQGEIGLLVHYLAQAAPHVPDLDLRLRMDSLLHRLTAWTEGA
ncbi:MAG TPA: hypothetical protein VHG91_21855 [Longimicrobium sp.]|nr:hypothetical protein [Longimicrobium sp.]